MHELIAAVEKATCKEDLIKVLTREFDRLAGDAKKQALIAASCLTTLSFDWERATECFRAHDQSVHLSLDCLEFIKAAKAEPYEDISEVREGFANHIKSLCDIRAEAWNKEFEAEVQVAAVKFRTAENVREEQMRELDRVITKNISAALKFADTPLSPDLDQYVRENPPQMFVGVDYGYGTDEAVFAVVEVQSDGTMKVADIERKNEEFLAWRTRSIEEEDGTLKIGIDAIKRANIDKIKLSFDESLVEMQQVNPHLNLRRLENGHVEVTPAKYGSSFQFTPTECGAYLVKNGGGK